MADCDVIRLEVLTTHGPELDAMVERFSAPGAAGSTGVLRGHAPLVALLEPGVLSYVRDGAVEYMAVGRGCMEVADNHAVVLVSFAEQVEEIDENRARLAMQHAREEMAAAEDDVARAEAEYALQRAKARLKLVSLTSDKKQ